MDLDRSTIPIKAYVSNNRSSDFYRYLRCLDDTVSVRAISKFLFIRGRAPRFSRRWVDTPPGVIVR